MARSTTPIVKKDAGYVLRTVAEHNVKFISLRFTDILGFQKSCDISADELPKALTEGLGFDGSSIEGLLIRMNAPLPVSIARIRV